MKAPNILSLVLGLIVVLPGVSLAITQQAPPAEFWWSALITGVIGAVVKALQVYAAANKPLPPGVDASDVPPSHRMKAWLRE